MKCIYCGRNIAKNLTEETHSCRSKRSFEKFGQFDDKIVEMIQDNYSLLYIVNNSLDLFRQQLPYHYLQNVCVRRNIKTPSLKDTANNIRVREAYKKTITEIYGEGITNISQAQVIKDKKTAINLERYGVENQFQREIIKEQSKATLVKKYGVEHPIHISDRRGTHGRFSKPHQKVSEYLNLIGIEHLNDKPGIFMGINAHTGKKYCPIPDIYIPEKKVVIEVYGDRWHMNPLMFQPTDIVHFFTGNYTGEQVWEMNKRRVQHIESFGIEVMILWEIDIKKNFESVKQRLNERLL